MGDPVMKGRREILGRSPLTKTPLGWCTPTCPLCGARSRGRCQFRSICARSQCRAGLIFDSKQQLIGSTNDENKIADDRWVPCIWEDLFFRVRLTMRYCEICKRAFCEGDQAHGPIGGLKKAAPMMSAAAGFTISPSQTILHIRRSSLTFVKCSQRRFADAFLRRCLLRER